MFDALEAEFKRALDLRCDALTTPEHLAVLQRCEKLRRWLPAVEHPVINQLSSDSDFGCLKVIHWCCWAGACSRAGFETSPNPRRVVASPRSGLGSCWGNRRLARQLSLSLDTLSKPCIGYEVRQTSTIKDPRDQQPPHPKSCPAVEHRSSASRRCCRDDRDGNRPRR